jgi:hypothetical protein
MFCVKILEMNKVILVLQFFLMLLLTSCYSPKYFQVYNVQKPDNIRIENNSLVFEDTNCKIYYDLWANGGNFSYKIYNKTSDNIYIHMDESFYIKNGIANNYFNNSIETNSSFSSYTNSNTIAYGSTNSMNSNYTTSRAVTGYNSFDLLQTNKLIKSNSFGISNTFGVSNTFQTFEGYGKTLTKIEERIVIIPKNSAKIFYGKLINNNYFKFNNFKNYPKRNEFNSLKFTKENTPISFSNIISYSLTKDEKLIKVYNDFFVSEIFNYNGDDIIKTKNKDINGNVIRPQRYFTIASPDKFYLKLQY